PGHYGNLDIAQAKQLSAFKRALTKTSFLPDPAMVDEEHQDTILLRFLRARDWNVQHAFKMYSDTIKWRKDVDLPSMMQGSFDFEERDKVAAGGWKMYFHGTDKFHRPIFVQDLAGLNTTEVFTHTTPDRVINFFACMLEDAVQRRYRACTSRVRRLCVDDNFMILNVAGIGMGTFWAFKGQLQQLLGILDTNFPELSGRVQIINAPWLFSTIWSYIKGWLPVNTAEKIDIVGTDFKAKLLEFIDEEQLPSSIGGSCQCGGKGCEFSDIGPWQE
ncbi:CRAL/TRIO domain-containing protein, partial [Acaromyces ingoldii]